MTYNQVPILFFYQFVLFGIEHLVGYLPVACVSPLIGYKAPTFLFTNVPGGSQVNLFEDCVLEKIVPIAPNLSGIGNEGV